MPDNVVRLPFGKRTRRRMSDFYGDGWGALNQEPWLDHIPDREITGETWRVLFAVLATLDKGNRVRVRTSEIAEITMMSPSQVSVQIKKLLEKEILFPGKRKWEGWRLNPRYGFKGEPDKQLRRAPGGELVLVD